MDYAIFNVILHQTTYLNNTFPDLKIQTYPKTYYTFHRKYSTNDLCGLWVQSWPTFLSNSSLIALASLIIGSNLSRSSWSNISSATKKGTLLKTLWPLFMDGVQLSQDYNRATTRRVYFLPIRPQDILFPIWSIPFGRMKGWANSEANQWFLTQNPWTGNKPLLLKDLICMDLCKKQIMLRHIFYMHPHYWPSINIYNLFIYWKKYIIEYLVFV